MSTLPVQVTLGALPPTTAVVPWPLERGRDVESRAETIAGRSLVVPDWRAAPRPAAAQVVLGVDVGAVVYDELDLRDSAAAGFPLHTVGASLVLGDPYARQGAGDRGTLVDRYV